MDQFDVGLLSQGVISGQSPTSYTVTLGPEVVLVGGSGFTFDASGNPTGGTVTSLQDQFQGATNFTLQNFSVTFAQLNTWAQADDKTSAFNGIFSGFDTLTGGPMADHLRGYGGNDSISGGGGSDTLDGGVGADTLNGGAGHDVIITGGLADLIVVGLGESATTLTGADVITDWTSSDKITFATGPAGLGDYVETTASDFNSALSAANQLIASGTKNIVMVQVGSDTVVFADSGNDNGIADDAVILSGKTLNDVSAFSVSWSTGVDTTPVGGASSGTGGTGATGGTTGGTGGGTAGSTIPTAGNDNLVATAQSAEVHAGSGNDTITGAPVQDYLRGDDGDDVITGGPVFDDINGNMGNDTLHGGTGDDWVVGGKDNDIQFGDDGNDIVWGNLGDDTLDGGTGNDQVRGGKGDDSLSGGAGNDYVSGDRGNDTETGGAGADIFHSFSGAGVDRVLDFHVSEGDRVMLDPGTTYTVSQVGADTVVDMGAGDQLILVGLQLSTLPAGWIFESF